MSRSIPASRTGAAAPDYDDRPLIETEHRTILLLGVMMVSICQFFDATIANVALPHMQVSLGASSDSVTWVLTSYIMAGAIFMPMTGWLSDRIGSRNLFIWSSIQFLVASALCGAATSLPEMVVFRALQGMSTAFIGPMTQTILFDATPPSKQGATMSYFGMMVMVAPISGPFVGGFLTEYLNWRWIYYVNLPIGIPAIAILWWLLPNRPAEGRRLDKVGFVWIGLGLGALQLMLDRGQQKDWLQSWEIITEGVVALSALWVFLVHSRTVRNPLFARELFKNANFLVALGMMFILGLTNVALSAVLPTMYQEIYNYPVVYSGLMMAPRGIGVIITSQLTVYLMKRFDYRFLIVFGYLVAAYSIWIMTGWSLDMDSRLIVEASFIQGLGLGMVFAPMNVLAFGTIRPELRPDGSSLMALFRNLGGSFGISIIMTMLARNMQTSHSDLAATLSPDSLPGFDWSAVLDRLPGVGSGVMDMINAEVSRQAAMIAYLDNFYVIFWVLLLVSPLPLLLKKPHLDLASIQHTPME
jgi:DHA2 family multidrug resistance protein